MIVLGISGGLGHDAAAAVVVDGALEATAEEERFTRVKGAPGLPAVTAAKYCLSAAGIGFEDVDILALAWDPALEPANGSLRQRVRAFLRHEYFRDHQPPEVVPVDHHLAHGAASYHLSGFERAAILVVDGTGEVKATTLAEGRGPEIRVLRALDPAESLGFMYSAATRHIGLGKRGEGKTMGLAPYGKPVYELDGVRLTADGYTLGLRRPDGVPVGQWWGPVRDQWLTRFAEAMGVRNQISYRWHDDTGRVRRAAELPPPFLDFAASVQSTLERVILHLVELITKETGCRNLVLAGGTALNCTTNGLIRRSGMVDDLYLFPAANDGGTAAGAALHVAAQHGELPVRRLDHADLGPSFSAARLRASLARLGLRFEELDDVGAAIASLLCDGQVVGWFEGRMEIGPRALGHRSILADPTLAGSHARVNAIKGREPWRPLAPSLLWEDAQRLLGLSCPTPFMLEAVEVSDDVAGRIPAVTHVDSSTRPQTVTSGGSDQFVEVLRGMRRNRGLGAVLNTSFNLEQEPIVCSPADAVRTFFASELDALVMVPFLIRK